MEIRALQIDLARQKENLEFIYSYVDFAVKYEYNTIFLYLENAVRTKNTAFFSQDDTYSEEEIKSIVSYAKKKGVQVIPALETLGHLEKFFRYEELIPLAEKDEFEMGRKLYSHKYTCGCVSNPKFIEFMDEYVKDVVSLFDSKYVHVGLDETFNFAVCKDCRSRIENGEPAKEIFYKYVMHVYDLIKSLGKTMMMWDDFFEYFDVVERLPRDIVMCNWNYMFVSDEPAGHWVNRIKKNWFALYDQLGFNYIFCTYSHRASSTYAIDSFSNYAEKYKPIGALMTAWCRNESFYQGSYPCVAYAGLRWAGKAKQEDKVEIYSQYLQNREAAELISKLNVIETSGFRDISKITECDYLTKWIYRDTLSYALPKLKEYANNCEEGEIKDVLTDIYDFTLEQYNGLLMQKAGVDYFDNKGKDKVYNAINIVRSNLIEIKNNGEKLWAKYRKNIKSAGDSFNKKFQSKHDLLDKIENAVKNSGQEGVLYLDLMLPDSYGTVRGIVEVCYENGEREVLLNGPIKSSVVLFDVGGCYHYRLKTKPVKIDKLIFSVYGEGAMYPTHFRYEVNGDYFVAKSVKAVSGNVKNAFKILRDDTRFAEMGYDDGVKHVEDVNLCKQLHTIEITFERLK